jgi:hypothetical protein
MRSKLLGSAAALALAAGTVLASAMPASAQHWHGGGGWHGGGFGWRGGGFGWPAAAIVGGAVAAATSPLWAPGYYDYYPDYGYGPYGYDAYGYGNYGYDGYGYGNYGYAAPPAVAAAPGPAVAQGDVAYCESRFRSYDPSSGTYLGFDGQRHPCP